MEDNIVVRIPGRDGVDHIYYINRAIWQTQRDWYLDMENTFKAEIVKRNQELYNLNKNGRK